MSIRGAFVLLVVYGSMGSLFWWVFRGGGSWGQRPSTDRALVLGGLMFLAGMLLFGLDYPLMGHAYGDAPYWVAAVVASGGVWLALLGAPWLRRYDERPRRRR